MIFVLVGPGGIEPPLYPPQGYGLPLSDGPLNLARGSGVYCCTIARRKAIGGQDNLMARTATIRWFAYRLKIRPVA